ncbi:MAG: Twin-arginine translocase TatA/TatE family subunit, partial [Candidatus Hydrogenedentes bacterium]|nr:Twin-arginine translocase TatA/TatE family subunit [Candidatus Hydrogenedentota bacterium]
MLGVGFGEMVIIAGIALVVIGPEKFPEFAKIFLRTVRDVRGYVDEAKRDIAKELKPIQKELGDLSRYKPEEYIDSLMAGDKDDKAKTPDAFATPQNSDKTGKNPEAPYNTAENTDLYGEYKPYSAGPSETATQAPEPNAADSANTDAASTQDNASSKPQEY